MGCPHAGCGQQIGATDLAGTGLKACGRCRRVAYCSKKCQVAAWKAGHKQECMVIQEGGTETGGAAAQHSALADLLRTRRTLTGRQKQVIGKMVELGLTRREDEIIDMAEEGLVVADELRSTRPELAADIYRMIGQSYSECCDYLKAIMLLERARAMAGEVGDRVLKGNACNSLGECHLLQGDHEKAITVLEEARAIAAELNYRENEGATCSNLGRCYGALKQYDKAIELFEQSLDIHEELDNKPGAAIARASLGHCLSQYCVCMDGWMDGCVCMCVCTYMHIYIYTHTYMYIYIHA